MDNAKIHRDPELLRMCEEKGVHIEYLPPYSPDLYPIEITFALLKAWIRRHHEEAYDAGVSGTFRDFLDEAIMAQRECYDAANLYRRWHIGVE